MAVQSYKLVNPDAGGVSKLNPVRIAGPEETVFDWSKEACDAEDIPDSPARAYRDARGNVHLLATTYLDRQMTGRTLNDVKHDCAPVMRSAYDADPSRFEDREWIFSPYTLDGKTVFGLIHDEYQGNTHPGRCPSGLYLHCWYNAVTLARSDDGGATFRHARPAPDHLVAEVPYPYTPDLGRVGVFQPSNIVQKDGYYYSMASTTAYGKQKAGACVMRTRRLGDPASWRAWDGDGYNIGFVDPYRTSVDPASHVCAPVSPEAIGDMTFSLTYNTYFGKYLLVGTANEYSPAERRNVFGFYYSISGDLIDWSPRKLVREAVLIQNYRCGGPDPIYYPSILDPGSGSRNFETTGRNPYLYFTRFHYANCRQTLDRDLVRVPIEFSK